MYAVFRLLLAHLKLKKKSRTIELKTHAHKGEGGKEAKMVKQNLHC